MKCSSISEWNVGDKAITKNGDIVTVEKITDRFIKIKEKHIEKQVYIPAHGEIEKLN